MLSLVVGASGATGRLLVEQLLQRGHHVRAVVRSAEKLPDSLRNSELLNVIETSVYDASDTDMARMVDGCEAIASCLGHNLTLRGILGHPRLLVTEVTRRLCEAAKASSTVAPIRFVLMNTAGNSNRDLAEPISTAQRCVMQLLRLAVPPHRDNELAADYLRKVVGREDSRVGWVVVRPDSLTNETTVTEYEIHSSPIRSVIFDPGKTSRMNTAHFMSQLITDDKVWLEWSGQMPVIYNVA